MERPYVTISAPTSTVQTGSFAVVVAFNEPVTGFVQSEFRITGTSGSTITNWIAQTEGRLYIAYITPSSDEIALQGTF